MDRMVLLAFLALAVAAVAVCVSIVCLVRLDRLSAAVRQPPRGRGRGAQRLMGRGKLVHWPHHRPHR